MLMQSLASPKPQGGTCRLEGVGLLSILSSLFCVSASPKVCLCRTQLDEGRHNSLPKEKLLTGREFVTSLLRRGENSRCMGSGRR